MNELNDLIERLYKEGIENGGLPKQIPDAVYAPQPADDDAQVARLRRTLKEMGELLNQEDQPDLNAEPPSGETCLRLMNDWASMRQAIQGIRQHMQSLELDIVKMQPWGNFDVMKVSQLAEHNCHIRFWNISSTVLAQHTGESWFTEGNVLIVAQDAETAHFVTVSIGTELPSVPAEAVEVEICPSPVSTLIMLQTRDKDSLKRIETLLGDFALVHYGELYAALRKALPDGAPLPQLEPEHQGLRHKLHQLFKKQTAQD